MARDSKTQIARKRAGILVLVLAIWALAILARLVQLQVLESDEYALYAQSQQTQTVKLLAPRGTIYDRNGSPLALSLEHDSIAINPMRVPDPAAAAKELVRIFPLNEAKLRRKIESFKAQRGGFLWIRRWATPEESKAARALRFRRKAPADWIEFYKEHKRYYPKGHLASHVLGSVGLEESGLFGIEYKMEDLLAGHHGEASVLQDVRQRGIETRVTTEPRPGSSIRISIDQRIQHAAESALRKAIKSANVPTGSVIVMDPHSGDVLAMTSYPDFDPNIRARTNAELDHRINRGMSLIYEPGSVFKVITLAAALEKTRLKPASIIDCGNGSMRLPGRVVRDHHSYPALSFEMVLAKSSNIGAINIANVVGKNTMHAYMRAFGFGERTGIELPFEEPGYVWPMHKIEKYREYSNILASVAMGHQVSATTLQLAQACSVIANGGNLVRPRILLESQSPAGEVKANAVRKERRVIRPETAITMRKMMETVVLDGTGKSARLAGWTAGGKTGTAQIFDLQQKRYLHEYHSSFIGFAPLQNPSIVVVVTLDRSRQYGGAIAAPVFQEVASETLRILGVPMDNPATAMAKLAKPEPKDVEEGDFGLESESLPLETSKLLPDTRRQVLGLLAAAIKADPEIEDWMLPAKAPEKVPQPAGAPVRLATMASVEDDPLNPERQFQRQLQEFQQAVKESEAQEKRSVTIYVKRQTVPDFLGKSIRDVLVAASGAGLDVEVYGRGIARTQIPPAGTQMPEGEKIRVLFTP